MPEVIFNGPAGRIEARYHHAKPAGSPIAILLHPHPAFGGTMNNPIVHSLYQTFVSRGFSVLRFNFRGVGRSQGLFENGAGELSDAASALDWLQSFNREAKICWIAGVSFGAWISMQLLMRRPEIGGFISIAPLAKHYDFSFLACHTPSVQRRDRVPRGRANSHWTLQIHPPRPGPRSIPLSSPAGKPSSSP